MDADSVIFVSAPNSYPIHIHADIRLVGNPKILIYPQVYTDIHGYPLKYLLRVRGGFYPHISTGADFFDIPKCNLKEK